MAVAQRGEQDRGEDSAQRDEPDEADPVGAAGHLGIRRLWLSGPTGNLPYAP